MLLFFVVDIDEEEEGLVKERENLIISGEIFGRKLRENSKRSKNNLS